MSNPAARRRFFAIKASINNRANVSVTFAGHKIAVNEDNAQLVEFLREADAQSAYEAAAFRRPHVSRIAA